MAKLSITILFLFFTLSVARIPGNDVTHLKLPSENDVILPEHSKTLPENDVIIPELPKILPENDVILPELPKTLPESDDSTPTVHSVPLNFVRFRPINRRFRLRSNLPFRLCNHMKAESRHQIPFGNDMILSSKRNIDFDKFVYRIGIGVSQIPSDRFDLRHHKYNDKKIWKFLDDREKLGKMKLNDQPHQHHHHDEDNEDNDHQQEKISKFLDDREKFVEMKLKHHHHDEDNEDNDHQQRKISKFLDDREKFGGMIWKDQLPHYYHHSDDDNEDNDHQQRKISKFLDDREKFGGMIWKDQLPHYYHHSDDDNEDNDHQQRKMWKFLDNREKFGRMKLLKDQLPHHHHDEDNEDNDHQQRKIAKFQNQFGANQDDEDEKRSKLYGKHYEMKLRKRFRYNAGEEEDEKAKDGRKWHKEEKKKGGFMRSIRKFLHHYFD